MATNDYQTFGDSGTDGVNKLSLTNYIADQDRVFGNGYTTKVIRSQLHNKALQQTSKMSSAVAQFLVNNNISALDTDTVSGLATKLGTAVGHITDSSVAVQSSMDSKILGYFTGTNTGVLSVKITGLVTATASTVDLGFMEITITQDDRDHSSATNPSSYKFMIKGNMDTGVWYNTQAVLLGTNATTSINVRFTRTATDAYIEIGETTSTWYYATAEVYHVSSYILAGYAPSFVATIQASLLGTTATDSTIAVSGYASLNSPTFTGTPTAPTPTTGDNSTKISTTAFVKAQGYLTSALQDTSHSFTANGYQQLSNGLILQWGSVSGSTTAQVVQNFPIAFPNTCLQIIGADGGASRYSYGLSPISNSQLGCYGPSTAWACRWIAIGN